MKTGQQPYMHTPERVDMADGPCQVLYIPLGTLSAEGKLADKHWELCPAIPHLSEGELVVG